MLNLNRWTISKGGRQKCFVSALTSSLNDLSLGAAGVEIYKILLPLHLLTMPISCHMLKHTESSLRLILNQICLTFRKKLPSLDFSYPRCQYVISSIVNTNNDDHNANTITIVLMVQ